LAIRLANSYLPTIAVVELRMRFILLIAGLAMVPHAAGAQPSICQSIANQTERLACYDKGYPPSAPSASPKKADTTPKKSEKSTVPKAQPDQGAVVDMLAAENRKLDAKLKTICRGC
jgi:hypothetical protein